MYSPKESEKYDDGFYTDITTASVKSAKFVLGILYSVYRPRGVIDVGCGQGAWLLVAELLGSDKLFGVDGPWVQRDKLLSSSIDFRAVDLEHLTALEGKYDLCISLEVAEHLSESRAKPFVDMLCDVSDVVLFSAAVPNQGGTHHVNEQWPSYWAKLFWDNGYVGVDIFRGQLWNNEEVEWWFRQNVFLYVRSGCRLIDMKELKRLEKAIPDVIHPENHGSKIRSFRKALQEPSFMFCVMLIRRYFGIKLKALLKRRNIKT